MSDTNFGQSALPSGLGTGLYDFGYSYDNLPPSGAASTAAQYDEGGVGFDWNQGLKDILGAWVAGESRQTVTAAPVQYRRGADGQVYVTDPAYRSMQQNLGIPSWLILGGVLVAVIMLAKD